MGINWAYLAGFTDGEGWIGIIGRGPRIVWGQKDREMSEVVYNFLTEEGYHPILNQRKPKPGRPVGLYTIALSRRNEVKCVLEKMLPFLVLKAPKAKVCIEWVVEHPSKINYTPVDIEALQRLAEQGYTLVAISKRLNHCKTIVHKAAKENGIMFQAGGKVEDGKHVLGMTKEQYLAQKRTQSRTGECADCGAPIYHSSTYCATCALRHRPKRSRDLVTVTCLNCGKPIEKIRWQAERYPRSFCNYRCRGQYKAFGWSNISPQCIDCGTTEKPHRAGGRCSTCHSRWYRQEHKDKTP